MGQNIVTKPLINDFPHGTVHFDGVKIVEVLFTKTSGERVVYSKAPVITLTLNDYSSAPPFKQSWSKEGILFIGFKIKFTQTWTGDVDWSAREVA